MINALVKGALVSKKKKKPSYSEPVTAFEK